MAGNRICELAMESLHTISNPLVVSRSVNGDRQDKRVARALIVWPHPRLDRVRSCLGDANLYEQMDGLSYLSASGIQPAIMDSSRGILNPLRKMGSLLAGIDPVRFLRMVLCYRQFDLLVSIDSSAAFLLVMMKRLLHLRKPVVVIDPALDPTYVRRMQLHRQVLPFVDQVIVFSRTQVSFLEHEYSRRARVTFLHHRIDTSFFDRRKSRKIEGEPYLFAIGNDISRDFELLLEAAERLSVPVVLHTSRKINRPVPPGVRVQAGWISFEQLRDLYANALAVVMPLHDTLHPGGINSVLEALSMSCPLVASASKGVIDYLEHGKTAWVVEPGNVQALRAGLDRIIADAPLRKRLGESGRQFCETTCAMPIYAARVGAILGEVIVQAPKSVNCA